MKISSVRFRHMNSSLILSLFPYIRDLTSYFVKFANVTLPNLAKSVYRIWQDVEKRKDGIKKETVPSLLDSFSGKYTTITVEHQLAIEPHSH